MKSQFFIISAVAISSILILLPLYLNPEELRIASVEQEINLFENIKRESKQISKADLEIFKTLTEAELKDKGVILNINYTVQGSRVFFKLDLSSQQISLHDEYLMG